MRGYSAGFFMVTGSSFLAGRVCRSNLGAPDRRSNSCVARTTVFGAARVIL